MSKFKVKFKNSQVHIKSKLASSESVNERELEIFKSKYIRGLTRPNILNKKKIEYTAPCNYYLKTYLSSGISKNDFFVVFAQVIEVVKKVEMNNFEIGNLVLQLDYTFFNSATKEVQFIYQPIISQNSSNNIFTYIYELISSTVLNLDEDDGFLNNLINYLKSLNTFSTNGIEKYILNVYPKVYKQVKRHKAGQSQPLKDIGRDFYDSDKRENSGDFQEEADEKETDLLDKPDERDTALLTDDEKETGLLGDEEDTQLLESYEPNYPYIIRLNTDEKIYIDKPVFRIGKEKSYVDYFIASNNAISRIHADIITKDNKFFVKDNNSTNHTFVNGSMITQRQIAEIYDGDSLMFANEPFEFHISQ